MAPSDEPKKSEAATQAGTPSNGGDAPRGAADPMSLSKQLPSVRPGGPQSLIGTVLSGRYRIEELIGEGGMGAVYRAEHTHMRKRLAVKVLHPEMSRLREVVQRFEREAMAAAHIDHPNVATATDFGKLDDGSFFLVLEYVEGKSLREAISKGGRLELGRALHVTRQIASALGRAHALGIVHRDLKPENVMLIEREGDPDFVKVLDFGIAKVPVGEITGDKGTPPGQALTQLGMVYGTPEYMAPEQALGQPVDPRADIYALGVMAYEMLTGVRPFDHESKVTLLGMHVTAAVPPMEDKGPGCAVPPEVEAIFVKCMAKESTHRYADAKELIDTITTIASTLAAQGYFQLPPSLRASQVSLSRVDMPALTSVPLAGAAAGTGFGAVVRPPSMAEAPAVFARPRLLSHPMSPRLLALAGGGAGVLVLVVIVGMLIARAASGPASPTTGDTPTGAASVAGAQESADSRTAKLYAEVAAARADVEGGNPKSAIERLAPFQSDPRAEVHQILERAYVSAKQPKEAMQEAALWLKAEPAAGSDSKLAEDVRNASLDPQSESEAFALLEQKMGFTGIDLLYDLAYLGSGAKYPRASARAKKALEKPEVQRLASPGLAVTLEFRDAKKCDDKHALLDRAKEVGDYRLLPLLKVYQGARGCGFLGRGDCYPCMHKDSDLHEAITAIQARPKP